MAAGKAVNAAKPVALGWGQTDRENRVPTDRLSNLPVAD